MASGVGSTEPPRSGGAGFAGAGAGDGGVGSTEPPRSGGAGFAGAGAGDGGVGSTEPPRSGGAGFAGAGAGKSRAVSAPLARIPNALTVLRLALIPLFIAVFLAAEDGSSLTAAIIFAIAGITDQLDGWLARRWQVESRFGRLADPLADRLMIDAAVILLWLDDKLPWPAALIIVARDVILIGGYRLLVPHGYELSVSKLGKAATWLLYCSLGFLIVVGHDTEWPLWLFWIALGLAVVAAAQYVVQARREVRT